MSKPIDFAARRAEKVGGGFPHYVFDESDVGLLSNGQVSVSTGYKEGEAGIQMSPNDALRLAAALIQAVAGPEIEEPRRAGG